MMWFPSGHSALSNAVGITPSLNGRVAGHPCRASWNAFSMYSMVGAISTEPLWCSCRLTGVGDEGRELGESQIDLDDAAAALPALDVRGEIVRQVLSPHLLEECGAGMQRGDDN